MRPALDRLRPLSVVASVRDGFDTGRMARRSDAPTVSGETAAPEFPSAAATRETLSQLLARILDQLSVSAWLPAAALVSLLFVVGNLRSADGHLSPALHAIGATSYASIILLTAAVVVTTVVTQAFEFEGIQLLEGYWGHSRFATWVSERRSAHYLRRRATLAAKYADVDGIAYAVALKSMRENGVPDEKVRLIEEQVRGVPAEASLPESPGFTWFDFAPPSQRRRMDALSAALREYPTTPYLIMPTKFGNAMRACEERARQAGAHDPLESFVQEVFHLLPRDLQLSHDQFRSRLDLYASLFVVLVLGAIVTAASLVATNWVTAAITAALVSALAWLSYRAAIASARAYGTVLTALASYTPPAEAIAPPTTREAATP
jgi:hypothetical protein